MLSHVLPTWSWHTVTVHRTSAIFKMLTKAFALHTGCPFACVLDVKTARARIANESSIERSMKSLPPWPEDCGWGSPESDEYAGIHFKRSVAASLAVISEKAAARDQRLDLSIFWHLLPPAPTPLEETLRLRNTDIGLYMRVLSQYVPGLDEALCAEYAGFVCRARAAGPEFTMREYRIFVGVFLDVVRRIERRHGGKGGASGV
jgi:hypothetical protein